MKRRSYSYDVDTESDKDEVADNGSDNDNTDEANGNTDCNNDNTDCNNDEANGDNDNFGLSTVDYEPRVTLCDMITDLDDCEAGTAFLNVLEAYIIFMIALYLFFVIS